MEFKREALALAKMLKYGRLATQYAETLRKETTIAHDIKNRLTVVINKFRFAEREMLQGLPVSHRQMMEAQLLDVEQTSQMEAIMEMLMDIPAHARESVERYVESVYKLNVAQNKIP